MESIFQQNKKAKKTFDRKSRVSYFEMFEMAHKNLSIVDNLHQSQSLKKLMINLN
jgi:hypothetical protein